MDRPLEVVWSRPLPEGTVPSTVTVTCDAAGRWFCSILVQTSVQHLPEVTAEVGVDAGLTALVTLSSGEKITNPRYEQADRQRLARAQKALPLGVRVWICPGCGIVHDRDVNASRALLAAGRAVTACGDGVRPTRC